MDSDNLVDESKDDEQVAGVMSEKSNSKNEEDNLESEAASFSSSEQSTTKRNKSKGKISGDSGISMEKTDESSDEDSSKRQKLSESQFDSEVGECSASKCDISFPKLKSSVRKRYYRNKNSSEADEELGEASGMRKSSAASEEKSKSDDDDEDEDVDDDSTQDSDDAVEQDDDDDDDDRERSHPSPERGSSPLLDIREDDSNEWTTASEEELDVATSIMQKATPKSKCFVLKELFNRQIGRNPDFADRFYGSLRSVQRLRLKCKLNEHQGCVNSLNFNQKGNLLASASDDLKVNIWDWATEKKQFTFYTGHRSNVFQAKWMPLDWESLMVTAAHDGHVRLLELPVGKSRRIGSHQGPVHKIAMHKEMPHVVLSCGEDGKILSIDIRESRPRRLMVVKEESEEVQLYSINCHPLNSYEFCVGGRIQTVQVFDRRKVSSPLYKYCPSHLTQNKLEYVTCALYNYNGTEILASYNDEDIYLFDTLYPHPSGDYAHKYQGHRNNATVKGVNFFGPKSEYIVSGSDCGNIFIWDKDTESIVQWMLGDNQGVVNCMESHPSVPVLATSGLDYDVKVWEASGDVTFTMKGLQSCVKLNLKNRADELRDEPDAYDGQMLWILLRRIRQSERFMNLSRAFRRSRYTLPYRGGDEDLRESSSEHTSSNNSGSSSDDEESATRPQCSPS
ncbi:DDB1- and CUL4-associated factor 8-like isoform X1 [Leptopilina heterotoma]|uniref:DDB1- and CUL4-associated factor 8-like isoform X1 n=1 Tax=Leptopilina heterotoma TaxID=63436 RepID=UPI001CA8B4EB|nr:DDB1- and CUL4-associated factor 8-like isoform X1 [Leptopilina heterotoma]XP_043474765.1 DDB1- and CUL4-associated factor 8-like isoform X1 [Leptopilina heterotoma]XP_043474766.1 DDB1- and CUL4-associated factor 8-like isoform X1 [Leptopilina heterotoma]XP_043474767.1 DDB1- and CUL4-associated factor 8-like isoform X1 [Leptopilina heterotoma]